MYNREYADMALDALHNGITLREFCRRMQRENPKFPPPSTIRMWCLGGEDAKGAIADGFPDRYAIAMRALHGHWADEILSISDDGANDYMDRMRKDGIVKSVDHECVQRSKLRVETRRWLLSKLRPDQYADRLVHQQLGKDGQPIDPQTATIDLANAIKEWKPKGADDE